MSGRFSQKNDAESNNDRADDRRRIGGVKRRPDLKINEIQQKFIEGKQQVYIDKGISPATLSIVYDYFREKGEGLTIDEITIGLNLAYQTVHRYVQYLIEEKRIEIVPIYGQIGRPKNKYKLL
jgi:two-component system response regulator DctR